MISFYRIRLTKTLTKGFSSSRGRAKVIQQSLYRYSHLSTSDEFFRTIVMVTKIYIASKYLFKNATDAKILN